MECRMKELIQPQFCFAFFVFYCLHYIEFALIQSALCLQFHCASIEKSKEANKTGKLNNSHGLEQTFWDKFSI